MSGAASIWPLFWTMAVLAFVGLFAGGFAVGLFFARRDQHNEIAALREQLAAALVLRGNVEQIERKAQGRSL